MATKETKVNHATADMIVFGAKVTTLDGDASDGATAFAVRGERFLAVGNEAVVMRWGDERTRVVDAGGRRVIPGLNDSHLHAIRGGLLYNLELRWDGVATLERGLEMIREQAERTPTGQWVRVMGGWSPFQFAEKRMPTVAELNEAAPDTPVLVLFAYSEVILNKAAVDRMRLEQPGEQTTGGRYEFIDGGATVTGSGAVYATIAKLPGLTELADRINSTQNFLQELNRFGLTSTVDAGESATSYPDDYKALQTLASRPGFPGADLELPVRPEAGGRTRSVDQVDREGDAGRQPRGVEVGRICAGRRRRGDGLGRARLRGLHGASS